MTIRHWHFAEAVEFILESFNGFLSENKAASMAVGNNNLKGIEALSAMKDSLAALPQFQTLKAKVTQFTKPVLVTYFYCTRVQK